MRLPFLAVIWIFLIGCATCNDNKITYNSPHISQKLVSSVVLIIKSYIVVDKITLAPIRKRFSATGFSIFTDNEVSYILTNQHVCNMREDGEYMLTTQSGRKIEAKFVRIDTLADLCLLRAPIYIPALEIAKNNAGIGERVMTIGAPDGVSPLFVDGIVSGYYDMHMKQEKNDDGQFEIHFRSQMTSMPIYPGASGSPVFNVDGRVVGVVFATRIGNEHISFIVPITEVQRFIDRKEYVHMVN